MGKFKVGDEVRVIGGCVGELKIYFGRTGIIESINDSTFNPYRIDGFSDTNGYSAVWKDNELELVSEKPKKYLVYNVTSGKAVSPMTKESALKLAQSTPQCKFALYELRYEVVATGYEIKEVL